MINGSSAESAAVFGVFLICFAAAAILYIWSALALGRVFAKLGGSSVAAWIPVVNAATLYRLGGVSAVFVILLIPPLSIIGVVMMLTAVHRINLRFGMGLGMTVLAFFGLPLWASVLGFGAAVPIGGVPRSASVSRPLPPGDISVWVPTPTAPVEPSARRAMPAVPVVTAAPPFSSSASSTTKNPWAPPVSTAPANPGPPKPPTAVPVIRSSSVASPKAAPRPAEAPLVDEVPDLDKTVVSPRIKKQGWSITAEGGTPVKLSTSSALLGRNPAARADFPEAQLVAFADPSKTVSKTHAHLALVDGGWSLTDLASTNGSYLLSPADEESEISVGTPTLVGERFRLGDLTLRISTES